MGRGFETPTFAELAHQSAPATGLNFALEPARSRHAELGAKALFPRLGRVNAAVFDIQTKDEIVVDSASGGRTVFKNAGRTSRRGLELAAETLSRGPWDLQLAYTWMAAEFSEAFTAGTPPTVIPAGNLIPGVPKSQAYARLRYRRPGYFGALESLYRSRVAVNDANSEFAGSFAVLNLVGGLMQEGRRWRLAEFVRIDNLADRSHAGSVVVNETNSRFYEPAPGRNITLGIQANLQF